MVAAGGTACGCTWLGLGATGDSCLIRTWLGLGDLVNKIGVLNATLVLLGVGNCGCVDGPGVLGSAPGTVVGVDGCDTWASTVVRDWAALSRSWETSFVSLSESGLELGGVLPSSDSSESKTTLRLFLYVQVSLLKDQVTTLL